MPAAAFLTGFTLSLSLIVAIGAQNAFVLRQGLRREHVGAVVTVCAVLDVALMAAGVFGLGALVHASPRALQAITWAGAAVLVLYGLQALKRALAPAQLLASQSGAGAPRAQVVRQVLAISLLNPHVYLDTVVLVGAVGAGQPAALRPVFLLGAATASTLWFAALGYGARLLTPLFARPAAWRVLDLAVAALMFSIAWQLLVPQFR
ncbi:LysE/ArgO family amino acid transporter [Ottowia testudinis]|uniref:Amino acid transporter n=1 Tax=Ottowia testudinis TaxID=2816950 RepID=A0A975CFM1_9BURK|nr:LysE/ArgO family amino acid transporter [Ottowia testudinis]QTD43957.1 amino acid transporter [Ottowia testudinis]